MARHRTHRRAAHHAKRAAHVHRKKVKETAKDTHVGKRRTTFRTVNAPTSW